MSRPERFALVLAALCLNCVACYLIPRCSMGLMVTIGILFSFSGALLTYTGE